MVASNPPMPLVVAGKPSSRTGRVGHSNRSLGASNYSRRILALGRIPSRPQGLLSSLLLLVSKLPSNKFPNDGFPSNGIPSSRVPNMLFTHSSIAAQAAQAHPSQPSLAQRSRPASAAQPSGRTACSWPTSPA